MEIEVPADYSPQRDGTALFYFGDDPCFPCHPVGTNWNGFDNVKVSPQVREVIAQSWRDSAMAHDLADEESARLLEIAPDEDGLIDLSNGYATELDYANLQAVLDAGFTFTGLPPKDSPLVARLKLAGFSVHKTARGTALALYSESGNFAAYFADRTGCALPVEGDWSLEIRDARPDPADEEADTDIQSDDDGADIGEAIAVALARLAELDAEVRADA